jgi:hypothetical protein
LNCILGRIASMRTTLNSAPRRYRWKIRTTWERRKAGGGEAYVLHVGNGGLRPVRNPAENLQIHM